jgi:hypothetical protein
MITQDQANHLFEYVDGKLFWKNSKRLSLNGKEAGCQDSSGYIKVTVGNKQYWAHRIIYLMHHGEMPKLVDHADRNTRNNSIKNLRAADASKNGLNSQFKCGARSGCRNVTKQEGRNKYSVHIRVKGKSKFIGNFEDLELADLVAKEARSKYHGEFAFQE